MPVNLWDDSAPPGFVLFMLLNRSYADVAAFVFVLPLPQQISMLIIYHFAF